MGLVEDLREKFKNDFSPELLRSRLLWRTAGRLARSRWNKPDWKADVVSLSFFLERTERAFMGKGTVVWANLLFPPELIHAVGACAFYPEMASAVVASLGLGPRFLDEAASAGFTRDTCSFHRTALGAAIRGFYPVPEMMFSASYPCDSASHTFNYLAEKLGAEYIGFDVPAYADPPSLDILAGQFEEAALRLGERMGRRESQVVEGLREAVVRSNQARAMLLDIQALRRERPCPLSGRELPGQLSMITAAFGTEEAVKFFRMLRDQIMERRGAGGAASGQERTRLLWMHLRPYYPNGLADWLEERGARVVCDEFAVCTWEELDPDEPYLSLARKVAGHFLVGPADRRARTMTALAREYQVDGAVHFNHWGCRQSCAGAPLVRSHLQAEGVPTLILEGDCVDEREYQEGQMRTRLEGFLESL